MQHLLAQSEKDPKALPVMDRGDCLRELATVYSQSRMHESVASKGCRGNFFTLALDGSGDRFGKEDLLKFWNRLGMPAFRAQLLASTRSLRANGELRWDREYVKEMLESNPRRGHLDEYLEGQDDEGFAGVEPTMSRNGCTFRILCSLHVCFILWLI